MVDGVDVNGDVRGTTYALWVSRATSVQIDQYTGGVLGHASVHVQLLAASAEPLPRVSGLVR